MENSKSFPFAIVFRTVLTFLCSIVGCIFVCFLKMCFNSRRDIVKKSWCKEKAVSGWGRETTCVASWGLSQAICNDPNILPPKLPELSSSKLVGSSQLDIDLTCTGSEVDSKSLNTEVFIWDWFFEDIYMTRHRSSLCGAASGASSD